MNEGAITVAGWRLYYSDRVVDSKSTEWAATPSDDVQVLIVFYNESYQIFEDGELKTYPYRKLYCLQDYYWQFGAGTAEDAVTAGASEIKTGRLLPDEDWWAIYEKAHQDMTL